MKLYYYIWIFCLALAGCSNSVDTETASVPKPIDLLTKQKEFVAGEAINLRFDGKPSNQILLIQNAWGTFGLQPDTTEIQLSFTLPTSVAQKSGEAHLKLISNSSIMSEGDLNILPSHNSSKEMETYIGPTSIFADNKDRSMVVTLPQDEFGNPLPEGTKLNLTEKFKEEQQSSPIELLDLIAHDYVGARKKVGDIFITTTLEKQVSKEFTVNVLPTRADDFIIQMDRQHRFADGNQIVSFKTSTINDVHGNMVADGTLVNFIIKDNSGNQYQTYGQTLNGMAEGKMLHPEVPSHWKVNANISGTSISNLLELDFEAAVLDYAIHMAKDGKTITVGPILSYMNQWVPDGMNMRLDIKTFEGQTIRTFNTSSRKGMGTFIVPNSINVDEIILTTTVAGITKTIQGTPK
tara:strand:- start:6201 stop:7421 length:1221 start_codon:yes stop_codon:yes gene_type:complete